jgi:hypothetical protein
MILSALIGVLSGLLVGCRFKVFALIPAFLIGLAGAGIWVCLGQVSVMGGMLDLGCFLLALQAGYALMALAAPQPRRELRAGILTT